jgi:hypothetical protein
MKVIRLSAHLDVDLRPGEKWWQPWAKGTVERVPNNSSLEVKGRVYLRNVVSTVHTNDLQPGVRQDILEGTRKHLTSIKTKHRNRLNLEPALILALTKIRPRIEVLAFQKQVQSSHLQARTTLIMQKIFNDIILLR